MEEKSELDEIKKLVKDKRLIVGTKNTVKKLKENKLDKIWLSSNVPAELKEEIAKYAQMNTVTLAVLSISNDDLGVLCKKQFPVSIVSLSKVKAH